MNAETFCTKYREMCTRRISLGHSAFNDYAQVQNLLQKLDEKVYDGIIMNVATSDQRKWDLDKLIPLIIATWKEEVALVPVA